MKTTLVCSGGLDSVSLAHVLAADGHLSRLVSFRLWPASHQGTVIRRSSAQQTA